ncbi:MAG: 50S ribosomal protein L30e [Methanophagales archaeon]|nr:50S ribosomal protein L30e [Methanophagales archaeon]
MNKIMAETGRKVASVALSDVNRELQKVFKKGKVLIGSKETIKAFMRKEGRIIIHASNCPEKIKKVFETAGTGTGTGTGTDTNENGEVIVYEYPANSLELGLIFGKPYPIASLCITDTGDSEILRILRPNVHYREKQQDINMRMREVREKYR